MKRIVLLLATLLVLPLGTAEARPKNPLPQVEISSIVKVHPDRERSTEYLITIDAVDPNGVMSELAVDFGDGAVVWMLLACDPETTQPGDPVTQEISWTYAPGTYTVQAWGFSTAECFSGSFQESKTDVEHLTVP